MVSVEPVIFSVKSILAVALAVLPSGSPTLTTVKGPPCLKYSLAVCDVKY